MNSGLTAQGDTRTYRNFLLVACIANLLLNPVLMWGWLGTRPLGVAGIALATVIVQTIGATWLHRKVSTSTLFSESPVSALKPEPELIRQILQQAIPSALNMLTVALGVFIISWFAKHFGKEAVAASGIAMRIEQIVLMPAIGLGTAVLTLTGQNHGAGKPDRVRQAWRFNAVLGAALMVVGGILVYALREPAMRLLSKDSEVIKHGVKYLGYSSLTLATYPILFVTVFLMQGLKRPAYGFLMGLYRQILAPAVVFPLLAFTLKGGIDGLWLGILVVNGSAALFALWWGNRVVSRI
jgi:putative MATE family efflux protein